MVKPSQAETHQLCAKVSSPADPHGRNAAAVDPAGLFGLRA
jgi:hypothetical protein